MQFYITTLAIILFSQINAQVSLPYSTGFDSAEEQAGWTEYQTTSSTLSHWEITTSNPNTDPNCISHDYAPSTGIGLIDNWFVSPAFEITTGGNLDSVRHMFSGFSTPGDEDTIAIYLFQGSQDPNFATKILLTDFRGDNYTPDNVYRTKSNIPLAAHSGSSYIAFRYKNSNASQIWLTVHFDDLAISGDPSANLSSISLKESVSVYPSPTSDFIYIQNEENQIKNLKIFDLSSKCVLEVEQPSEKTIQCDVSNLMTGNYIVKIETLGEIISKEFVMTK